MRNSIIFNNAYTRTVETIADNAVKSGAIALVVLDGTFFGGYGGFYLGQALNSIAGQLPVVPDSFMSETPEAYRQLTGQLNELFEDALWAGGEVLDLIYQPSKDNWSFQPEWAG